MQSITQPDSDVIESAAELLNRLAKSARSMDTEQTVVLASAVLAVAVEVRRLTNLLAEMADGNEIAESVRIWGGE